MAVKIILTVMGVAEAIAIAWFLGRAWSRRNIDDYDYD